MVAEYEDLHGGVYNYDDACDDDACDGAYVDDVYDCVF